ncbi:Stage 0 sporulation protein A [Gemmata sp. SH-PL17]|uniref:response regulator n=1 Tax=Gemmata sp. SH-PL17 TaxID=1630693 RepID=UPI00078D281E|nr:response regulator [Gemmata sp. SH-PL17]AMV27664.1 Stage 0 sporulation protein A [Gemmata sp. SH-PL17]
MTATDLVHRPLGGARVLVAEGDADDSVVLTAVLRLNGFDACEARTAEDALKAASDTRPAVLMVDLDLPDLDGCALIRRVRRLPDPPAVVVVTGHTAESVRRAALAAGASAFLLKPADPIELTKLVGQLSDEQLGRKTG